MAAGTQISVEEYLNTSYRPDCDYVDGEVRERNLGERDHSMPQMRLIVFFAAREKEWGTVVLPEQRVQVTPYRFRIPDVCVLRVDDPDEPVVRHPPLTCIEILSKDDTFKSVVDRLDDYLSMGVANVWVLDPSRQRGYRYTSEGFFEAKDGVLRVADTKIEVPLTEIFKS